MIGGNLSFAVGGAEDDTGGTAGEEGAVGDDAALFGIELYIIDEGAGIAVVVFQGIAQVALFVATDGDGAVVQIDTGINGLEGAVGWVAFLIATYHIVAHTEGKHLFEMEHVLDDNDRTTAFFISILIWIFIFLTLTKFADAYTDAKLLAAVGALEYQRLTRRIFRLVESDILVAFGAAYAFHQY